MNGDFFCYVFLMRNNFVEKFIQLLWEAKELLKDIVLVMYF